MSITPETLTQWAQDEGITLTIDDTTPQIIRAARLLISDYLTQCRPATSDDQQAIDNATCAQAAYWITNAITPLAEDVQTAGKVVASSSLLGASITMADTGQARVQSRERAATTVCIEARIILKLAGIQPEQPHVVG